MKSKICIFIAGTEVYAEENGQLKKGPAVISIEMPVIKFFLQTIRAPKPPRDIIIDFFSVGPVIWDESLNSLTHSAWYWSHDTMRFILVRFYAKKHDFLFKGEPAHTLVGIGENNAEVFESIPLGIDVINGIAGMANKKKKFVLAVKQGLSLFGDFDTFQGRFQRSLDEDEEKMRRYH